MITQRVQRSTVDILNAGSFPGRSRVWTKECFLNLLNPPVSPFTKGGVVGAKHSINEFCRKKTQRLAQAVDYGGGFLNGFVDEAHA